MFTGIIEKTARVISVAKAPMFDRLTIASDWNDVRDGESIAVNGVCLTVAEQSPGRVGFDVITETLSRTNLGLLAEGDQVHVERSLRAGDRISGHFVQGHVDGVAALLEQSACGANEWRLTLECPVELAKYLTPKGSVTLDGVSLTIASVNGNRFDVALIPTTLQITTLGRRSAGWPFNLEMDVLAKIVISFLERRQLEQPIQGKQV
jgi:riboflavin synthase alpha subunit